MVKRKKGLGLLKEEMGEGEWVFCSFEWILCVLVRGELEYLHCLISLSFEVNERIENFFDHSLSSNVWAFLTLGERSLEVAQVTDGKYLREREKERLKK